jgi:hypothetical protein
MAISTVKSELITDLEASPIVVQKGKRGGVNVVIDQDAVPTTSIDEIGDVMLFCPVPSNAVILDVVLYNDDLDSNGSPALAANVGLYYSGVGGSQKKDGNVSGTVIDADCFGTAVTTLQAANVAGTSLRFEADNIINIKKEAWEVAGLTADPGGWFYVGLTVTTVAATAVAGDIVVKVEYL